MRDLQRRLTRELDQIADRATTSPDAMSRVQTRASAYRTEQEEEVVVMLTPADSTPRRARWLAPAALAGAAVGVLVIAGAIVLRDDATDDVGDDDAMASVDAVVPTPVFDFDEDDLCEWVTPADVDSAVYDAYTTFGEASPIPNEFTQSWVSGADQGCNWEYAIGNIGGHIGLFRDEATSTSSRAFVPHPGLSDGVLIDEEQGEFLGLYGWPRDLHLSVEGQPWTVRFDSDFHSGGIGDDGPGVLLVADGLLREMGWVDAATPAPEPYVDDIDWSLCDWITPESLSDIVAAETDWSGSATMVPTWNQPTCTWELTTDGRDTGTVTVADARAWRDADGENLYVLELPDPTAYRPDQLADDPEAIASGAVVSDHPALSDGVIAHLDGTGRFVFWVPGIGQYLEVAVDYEDDPQPTTHQLFSIADRLFQELGWVR